MTSISPTLFALLAEGAATDGGGVGDGWVLTVGALFVVVTAGLLSAARRRTGRPRGQTPAPDQERPGDGSAAVATEPPPLENLEEFERDLEELERELEAAPPEEIGLAERFRDRLSRTRNVLGASVAGIFGRGVTEEAFEALEEALITADVGVTATMDIVDQLRRRSREEGATDAAAVLTLLKEELRSTLGEADRTMRRADDDAPTVWLITGVNGTGKTTTIGKLAAVETRGGASVVMGAADTFRAAAAEQLGVWAERTGSTLLRKDEGADPASVAYEAYDAAVSKDADLLIVDTAGRLHNKQQLMDELGKVKRVLEKRAGPLEETILVLDATTGQNGIAQAKAFLDAVDVTGIALTKLDGSSKGGIVVAVQRELGIPVKLVGLGEEIDDLAPFDPDLFVEGLFGDLT